MSAAESLSLTIFSKVEEFQNQQHQPSVVPALEDIKPLFKTYHLGWERERLLSFNSAWRLVAIVSSLVFTDQPDLDLCERIFHDKKYGNWEILMWFQLLHERALLLKTHAKSSWFLWCFLWTDIEYKNVKIMKTFEFLSCWCYICCVCYSYWDGDELTWFRFAILLHVSDIGKHW